MLIPVSRKWMLRQFPRMMTIALAVMVLSGCGVGDTGRPAGQGAYPEPQGDTAQRASYPAPPQITPIDPVQSPGVVATPVSPQDPAAATTEPLVMYAAAFIGVLVDPEGKVVYIAPGGPASETTLQVGDIIEALDDIAVAKNQNQLQLNARINGPHPERYQGKTRPTVLLKVARDGKSRVIPVTPKLTDTWDATLPENFTYPEGSFYL